VTVVAAGVVFAVCVAEFEVRNDVPLELVAAIAAEAKNLGEMSLLSCSKGFV